MYKTTQNLLMISQFKFLEWFGDKFVEVIKGTDIHPMVLKENLAKTYFN